MTEMLTQRKKECSKCKKQFESDDDSAYCSFECAYGLNTR